VRLALLSATIAFLAAAVACASIYSHFGYLALFGIYSVIGWSLLSSLVTFGLVYALVARRQRLAATSVIGPGSGASISLIVLLAVSIVHGAVLPGSVGIVGSSLAQACIAAVLFGLPALTIGALGGWFLKQIASGNT
jgi:hypothetical protein